MLYAYPSQTTAPALHITNLAHIPLLTQTHKISPRAKNLTLIPSRLRPTRLVQLVGFLFGAVRPIRTRRAMTKNTLSYQIDHSSDRRCISASLSEWTGRIFNRPHSDERQ
ncbi:hypothetical protein BDW62DRAFT_112368 [Aspergillus aurantiobrunneus]